MKVALGEHVTRHFIEAKRQGATSWVAGDPEKAAELTLQTIACSDVDPYNPVGAQQLYGTALGVKATIVDRVPRPMWTGPPVSNCFWNNNPARASR